ncbi:hypothetical protein QZH56_01570 [Streptomyces olivoreticuli]|nr:hypothetical protein [Streptomyces olivoreticuli]WKK24379.1 hypothetical protein QZH56_01570 [Streptomyces olivoreticuli]
MTFAQQIDQLTTVNGRPTVEHLTGHPARPFTTWATGHIADFTTP